MKAKAAGPRVPERIRVERTGDRLRVLIDGVELEWEVDAHGVSTAATPGGHPGITLTIPARRVEVVDALEGRVSDDRRAGAREHLESLSPTRGR